MKGRLYRKKLFWKVAKEMIAGDVIAVRKQQLYSAITVGIMLTGL